MKAILVCHQAPRPVGHGGNRRAYQVQRDLEDALGAGNVVLTDDPWSYFPDRVRHFPFHVRRILAPFLENPLKLAARTPFTRRLYSFPGFQAHYEALVRSTPGPLVCVIEHPGFSALLEVNARHGVPTVGCSQNIEAFDLAADLHGPWAMRAKAIDFANEVEVLARCDHRLFISKVETGLMGGLGLSGDYYPYRPVGAIRERFERVRQLRSQGSVDRDLFLMLGTVGHESTRDSFRWFLENARAHGLPSHVRLVVAGLFTETLLPAGERVNGVELKGWLGEDDLDALLTRVTAVLVPQRQGFGALTRLPELSCAGVPVVVSRHATYAIDPPPGVESVDDRWDAWWAAMDALSAGVRDVPAGDYAAWDARQARPLATALAGFDADRGEVR